MDIEEIKLNLDQALQIVNDWKICYDQTSDRMAADCVVAFWRTRYEKAIMDELERKVGK